MNWIFQTLLGLSPLLLLFGAVALFNHHEKVNNPELLEEEDGSPLDLPPTVEELMRDPAEIMKLMGLISAVGFTHRAETTSTTRGRGALRKTTVYVCSELYVIRIDGVPQTFEMRERPVAQDLDVEGEELARNLARALDVECHVA